MQRVREALDRGGIGSAITVLDDSSRSAAEAAAALGVDVGQIASSIVFRLSSDVPLLVITSGRHRVDVQLVAREIGVPELTRADAQYVKARSGFSIGGVSPVGWLAPASVEETVGDRNGEVTVILDEVLAEYDVVWAAGGHPHAVFPATFDELRRITRAHVMKVASD